MRAGKTRFVELERCKDMKNNIVLIGMPGVGKSTIGVILAKELGYDFVDADLVIQKKTGKLLKDIIATEGIDGFRRIENEVNASLEVQHSVIATGGSVIYGKEAMEHLSMIGEIVYLKLDLPHLEKRLGNLKCRGVVIRDDQTLADLMNERTPLYEKYAQYIIDEEGKDIEGTLEELLVTLQSHE